jgi:hypothetical protein
MRYEEIMQASMGELDSMIEGIEARRVEERKEKLYMNRITLQYLLAPHYGWLEAEQIYPIDGYDVPKVAELTDEMKELFEKMDKIR